MDDAEEDESFISKDNLKRRQQQYLSSDVSQRWASSILMMFKALKFWQDVSTDYTSKTPRQDFPLLAIHMTILQIFILVYPVGELVRLSQTTSKVFVVPCVFLVVKLNKQTNKQCCLLLLCASINPYNSMTQREVISMRQTFLRNLE